MQRNRLTITIGVLLLVLFGFLLFSFQVRQTEVALVTTFGKPNPPIVKPGLYGRMPWPIQRVLKFDKRVQNFEDKFDETLTQDGKNLLVMLYVGWSISDPAKFRSSFESSITNATRSLEGLIRSEKNSVVGQHPFSHFISPDPNELKFEVIEKQITDRVSGPAKDNYGIDIRFLGIKRLGLPESISQKVFERMKEERQKFVKEINGQAESESTRIRSEADLNRSGKIAKAESEATRIRGDAEAQASQSLQVLERNPELANFLLKLNTIEQILKSRSTLILDQRTPPFDLFKGDPGKSGAK